MDDKSLQAIQNLVKVCGADSLPVKSMKSLFELGSRVAPLAEWRSILGEGSVAIEAAQANVKRFGQKGAEIADAAHTRGLIVPSSQMSLQDFTRLVDVYESQGAAGVISAIETEYEKIFSAPGFLNSLQESWGTSDLLTSRRTILNDALDAHKHRLFGASIPTLIAQAEGIIVELRHFTGKVSGPKLQKLLDEAVGDDPFTGRHVAAFFRNVLHTAFEHGNIAKPFSRHAILHGGDVSYASENNSRTAILLIDILREYETDPT